MQTKNKTIVAINARSALKVNAPIPFSAQYDWAEKASPQISAARTAKRFLCETFIKTPWWKIIY